MTATTGQGADTDERQPLLPTKNQGPLEISTKTRYGILLGIWSGTFLASLNMTLVPTMIPPISSEFKQSNQASWIGTCFLLATCTFTPLYGRLSNILGRRGAFQTALIFTAIGTMMCGMAKSMQALIFARFVAGIGGGGINTVATIIVSDMYSLRARGLTQGVASVFNGLGMGLGGPMGGIVTDWLGWRWAFFLQAPFFMISFLLTSWNLRYLTPGKGKGIDILKRIDYGGILALLISVGACLVFLSEKYNVILPWSNPRVYLSLSTSIVFLVVFFLNEIIWAREPMLAPALLTQRIPVLVAASNFCVAMCNFSVTFFFPMYFETVWLTSASVAGLHLAPNSVSMMMGSLFAGWMIKRTGTYKTINFIFGLFPFIAAILIRSMLGQRPEDVDWVRSWLSIIPLGFGNAVVLQTMLIALLAHLPTSQMAVGTAFGQLFRGIGQVGGVAIASAMFQSILDTELRKRIVDVPDAEHWIVAIRQSALLVHDLPPNLQVLARASYQEALKAVFTFSACMTGLAYIVRLPVPDKDLDSPRPDSEVVVSGRQDVESETRGAMTRS
ncbi:vacuolar amino acid permease [Cylindrobasidium torrendii FP15055 ss-10]|uniref:Vacuolar amino acid permease n=1 Tax=Cylindrobasidium torrendii FP15055 ss-10 TaxID=1314674 RepID=A0A0D7BFG2_9AGAR|nr:vacuolar amino acid permease [Cylindrobasidium torrendii FP15055 ss-10]